tara:strand:+ start:64 stop:240 length:177 start_codon:yes stop_codon:yes gene_type:complete
MNRQEILDALKDRPKIIYGSMPRGIYFALEHFDLITMTVVGIGSPKQAVEVRLVQEGH